MRRGWTTVVVVAMACDPGFSVPSRAPEPDDVVDTAPTYYRDVSAILTKQCAGCHRDGGVAPFALTTYDEAYEVAAQIADVTAHRIMPPWPADSSGACGTFVDQRWLSEAEIATLGEWAGTGAQAGDPADAPIVEPPPALAFTETVELASDTAYVVAQGPDEYRCFVVDPALVSDQYITALAIRLDQAAVVHHMQLYSADSDYAESSIAARDAADPRPGYSCDSEGVGDGVRYIGVWAAGDLVRRWPADSGIKLRAGRNLVVQFHYHNHGGGPVADRSRVALELADTVAFPGTIAGVSGTPLFLPPGLANVEVSSTRLIPVAQPSWARAARIHMHELGTRARMELVRGDQSFCLLDIPRWDFGWQLFYSFDQPVALERGDKIRISCSYDTRSQSGPVQWGERTEDEMCIGYTYFTP